jgi:hypothetical protein
MAADDLFLNVAIDRPIGKAATGLDFALFNLPRAAR